MPQSVSSSLPHLAYLYSRWPVVSQTFCDTEMLALEAMGFKITVASLNPPPNGFRHERLRHLKAEALYPPPGAILDRPLKTPPDDPVWNAMDALAREHEDKYGASFKPAVRARNAWNLAARLKRRGVRHVHVHFANRATHTALFLKKAGLPFSFTAHAQDFMVDLGNDDLLREMILEAEFVVAVSDFSRELLVKVCPEAESRILRVYNGIQADNFPPARPEEEGPLRIVSVGRLIEFKGFLPLLQALAMLRDRGVPAELQIIGEGPRRPELERFIAENSLGDRARLRGVLSQEAIKAELARAHLFALACQVDDKGASDILPTVILEAMAAGLPVVSTWLAGVPEMVAHGETGLLSAPGDAAAMAENLAELASAPAKRAAMGEAGRARVREIFSLEKTAGALAELFRARASGAPETSPAAAPRVLALADVWPGDAVLRAELETLARFDDTRTLAAKAGEGAGDLPVPGDLEFFPDAMVLEAAWRARPELASAAEALREKSGLADGEEFFRQARRAVYLASLPEAARPRHVHALRAAAVPCAWIYHRLTGVPVSAAIESGHGFSRSTLAGWLKDFAFGSISDDTLREKLGGRRNDFPDALGLRPPPKPRGLAKFFKPAPPAPPVPDAASVWNTWREKIFS